MTQRQNRTSETNFADVLWALEVRGCFRGCLLFWMPPYFFQPVGVADDLKIETPVVVDARLPQVAGFIVLFCAKGWMLKIDGKKSKLFPKGLPHAGRCIFQGVEHPVGKVDLHRLTDLSFFAAADLRRKLALSDAIASSAVSNGP